MDTWISLQAALILALFLAMPLGLLLAFCLPQPKSIHQRWMQASLAFSLGLWLSGAVLYFWNLAGEKALVWMFGVAFLSMDFGLWLARAAWPQDGDDQGDWGDGWGGGPDDDPYPRTPGPGNWRDFDRLRREWERQPVGR